MIGVLKENITYKYVFTDDERRQNSQSLAVAQVEKVELEDEKKAMTSQYKAKLDAKQSDINLLARQVIDGYTMRTKYALKRKNFAEKLWEWVDEDSGEVLKTEKLMGKDLQQDIPFPAKEETKQPFDEVTGDVPVGGDQPLPQTPPLPSMESLLGFDKPPMPKVDSVVSVEAEDLDNASESVVNDDATGYFMALPNAEARQLPEGSVEPASEDSDESDNMAKDDTNEGADFNADTYNPDENQPEPPKRGKRPRK